MQENSELLLIELMQKYSVLLYDFSRLIYRRPPHHCSCTVNKYQDLTTGHSCKKLLMVIFFLGCTLYPRINISEARRLNPYRPSSTPGIVSYRPDRATSRVEGTFSFLTFRAVEHVKRGRLLGGVSIPDPLGRNASSLHTYTRTLPFGSVSERVKASSKRPDTSRRTGLNLECVSRNTPKKDEGKPE